MKPKFEVKYVFWLWILEFFYYMKIYVIYMLCKKFTWLFIIHNCEITENIYWSLVLVPGTELLKYPCDFQSGESSRGVFVLIFGVWPHFLTQGSWNPCNFLGDRSVFCSIKVTLGELQDEGQSPGRKSHDRSLEFSAPTPILLKREEGLKTEVMMDHAYVMKPPQKSPKCGFQRACGLVYKQRCREGGTLGEGIESPYPFPHTYASLPSGCPAVSLTYHFIIKL